MTRQRLVVLLVGLLVVLAALSSLAPGPSQPLDSSSPVRPASRADGRTIEATLPGPGHRVRVVQAQPGDLVRLTVLSPRPDIVELTGPAPQVHPVEPATPARLLVAAAPGSALVRLALSGAVVGRLEVAGP